jgi:hypothetical protein
MITKGWIPEAPVSSGWECAFEPYSHSIVAGGFDEMS